ncbi:MAG: hypothetical protein H7A09_01390 [Oceanospirillaceae bacterium]|nr:hypothetical protein [Oceanospirillaceae bacterium]MCP5336016.1 hypothetical protein [Oceanospirillaceae bacterium]MCP5350257.1 hypothetical protein [Oceanospirillaceae bacterium]
MRAKLPWYTAVFAWLLSCNLLLCAHPLYIASPPMAHAQHTQQHTAHSCCEEKVSASADKCCKQDTQLQTATPDIPLAHFTYHYQLASTARDNIAGHIPYAGETYPPPLFLSSQRLRI